MVRFDVVPRSVRHSENDRKPLQFTMLRREVRKEPSLLGTARGVA